MEIVANCCDENASDIADWSAPFRRASKGIRSLAVYTDITEDELGRFLGDYDAGSLMSYKGIAEGVENSNFLLHTDKAPYILTLYEKRVDPADLPFFLGLMQHLADRGLSCPLPVARKDGQLLGELAGRPGALISFLEGMWLRKPAAHHCRQVGEALARMHIAGQGFEITRKNALSVAGWRPLWDKSEARADEVETGLKGEISAELDYLESHWPTDLPSGVIHADLFPDNVFFLDDKLSGLIDFYFACNDFLAYDLSVCLNAWCFEKDWSYNITKGMALIEGYQSVRPLSAAEAEALPLLCRGSALRFFLTRLYDWIMTPPGAMVTKKDPKEYLRKLRFHQNVLDVAEYGLDKVTA
jgi:homoserine kinase type II